jgi:hypothetical protein
LIDAVTVNDPGEEKLDLTVIDEARQILPS